MKHKLVISCHADTGFASHRLQIDGNGDYYGHLDNFVGVYAVMQSYFSGKLDHDSVRIELTYGEETGMSGAYEVLETLDPGDTVIVVDVTGTPTKKDLVIEKCSDAKLRVFMAKALKGISYDLYQDCPDPVANEDECDVYKQRLDKVCFLGIPCRGGDYNAGMVSASPKSVEAAAQAIIQIAKEFSKK